MHFETFLKRFQDGLRIDATDVGLVHWFTPISRSQLWSLFLSDGVSNHIFSDLIRSRTDHTNEDKLWRADGLPISVAILDCSRKQWAWFRDHVPREILLVAVKPSI